MGQCMLDIYNSTPSPAELDEDWYHSDDPINAGVIFFVKVGDCPYHTYTYRASGNYFPIQYNV